MKCFEGYSVSTIKSIAAGEEVYEPTSMHVFLGKKKVCVCGKTKW